MTPFHGVDTSSNLVGDANFSHRAMSGEDHVDTKARIHIRPSMKTAILEFQAGPRAA